MKTCNIISLLVSTTHTGRQCSSGDSCKQWTHSDCPETVGGRSQCQPPEQGDDHDMFIAMFSNKTKCKDAYFGDGVTTKNIIVKQLYRVTKKLSC